MWNHTWSSCWSVPGMISFLIKLQFFTHKKSRNLYFSKLLVLIVCPVPDMMEWFLRCFAIFWHSFRRGKWCTVREKERWGSRSCFEHSMIDLSWNKHRKRSGDNWARCIEARTCWFLRSLRRFFSEFQWFSRVFGRNRRTSSLLAPPCGGVLSTPARYGALTSHFRLCPESWKSVWEWRNSSCALRFSGKLLLLPNSDERGNFERWLLHFLGLDSEDASSEKVSVDSVFENPAESASEWISCQPDFYLQGNFYSFLWLVPGFWSRNWESFGAEVGFAQTSHILSQKSLKINVLQKSFQIHFLHTTCEPDRLCGCNGCDMPVLEYMNSSNGIRRMILEFEFRNLKSNSNFAHGRDGFLQF